MKKRRKSGVGFLIRVDPNIIANETNVYDPRILATSLRIHGFNIRHANVYSPTQSDSSKNLILQVTK